MSDSRLYFVLKTSEVLTEIKNFKSKRPPIGIIKKIIVNVNMGNFELVKNDEIFNFIINSCIGYKGIDNKNGNEDDIDYYIFKNLLEIVLCGGYVRMERDYQIMDKLYDWIERMIYIDEDFLRILSSIDISIGVKIFKKFNNLLWNFINEKFYDCDNIKIEYIYASIKLVNQINKINCIEKEEAEMKIDKIKLIFTKLIKIINKVDELKIVNAICDSLNDLINNKNYSAYLKLELDKQLSIKEVSKMLTIITKIRIGKNIEEYRLNVSGILSLLNKFKFNKEKDIETFKRKDKISKDIITCIIPFIKDDDININMNCFKNLIYYVDESDDKEYQIKIIREIFKNLNKIILTFENGNERFKLFNLLRNLIIIIIKYSKIIYSNDENLIKSLIKNIQINPITDLESYIIDTKLEILYLLSIRDIEENAIFDILETLIKIKDNDISYKTICTINNIIIKNKSRKDLEIDNNEKYNYLINSIVDNKNKLYDDKNLLCLSNLIKNYLIENKNFNNENKNLEINLKYLNKVKTEGIVNNFKVRGYFKDEDIINFIWILGEMKQVDELIAIKDIIKERVDCYLIVDNYLTSIMKVFNPKILNILQEFKNIELIYDERIEIYEKIIIKNRGFVENIVQMVDTSRGLIKNEDQEEQNELCSELSLVLDSVCCVYLRSTKNVFT